MCPQPKEREGEDSARSHARRRSSQSWGERQGEDSARSHARRRSSQSWGERPGTGRHDKQDSNLKAGQKHLFGVTVLQARGSLLEDFHLAVGIGAGKKTEVTQTAAGQSNPSWNHYFSFADDGKIESLRVSLLDVTSKPREVGSVLVPLQQSRGKNKTTEQWHTLSLKKRELDVQIQISIHCRTVDVSRSSSNAKGLASLCKPQPSTPTVSSPPATWLLLVCGPT
ncbi:unnamed protein product [Chrysoparadoxa australica]